MENAIDLALRNINHNIPLEILEVAFENDQRGISIEDCIHEDVIVNRILHDANIVAGKIKTIVLDPMWIKKSALPVGYMIPNTESYSIYNIPPEARENRPIASIISIRYPFSLYVGNQMPSGALTNSVTMQTVGSLACQVLDSQSGGNSAVMPIPHLVSGHQIKLTPVTTVMTMNYTWELNCRLSYDKEFTNLTQDALIPFADLALCATKAFIYNKLVLKADKFYTTAGYEWGRMKEIVDSYAQEAERYIELRKEFSGGANQLDLEGTYQVIYDSI